VQRFITAANDYLDGWFAIRIAGQGCGASCADRQMPIRVRLNRVAPSGAGGGGPPVITIGKPPPGVDRADWALSVGPHAHILLTVGDERRSAYLEGLRVGLERRYAPSAGHLKLGGYTEAGYGSLDLGSHATNTPQQPSQRSPYGIAGLQAGHGFQEFGSIGVDFSVAAPVSGRAVAPFTSSAQPQALTGWWQLGLSAALRF